MKPPRQVSFDGYLDTIFDSANWVDACVTMLSVFLEDIESCRDNPGQHLRDIAPSIVDQVHGVAARAERLERHFRSTAEAHGPEFQTTELGAILWWAGMASHKAIGAVAVAREKLSQNAWEKAYYEIHTLMYDTISAISLLAIAEGMIRRMESEGDGRQRPN